MTKAPSGKKITFEFPKVVTVMFPPDGATFDFVGVEAYTEESDGTLKLEKNNGNYVKVNPGWLFYEIGEVSDG